MTFNSMRSFNFISLAAAVYETPTKDHRCQLRTRSILPRRPEYDLKQYLRVTPSCGPQCHTLCGLSSINVHVWCSHPNHPKFENLLTVLRNNVRSYFLRPEGCNACATMFGTTQELGAKVRQVRTEGIWKHLVTISNPRHTGRLSQD